MSRRDGMDRIAIGIWSEIPPTARWANEGVSRVIGFLIEGAAQSGRLTFRIVVSKGMERKVEDDLSALAARRGQDWTVHAPDESFTANPDGTLDDIERARIRLLAGFANRHVPVEAWVVAFPFYAGSLDLHRPKAVLFPDALPYDFPVGWPDAYWGECGIWPNWRATSRRVMEGANTVITFSEHVAQRHVANLFSVPRAKVHVVPLAPPDLSGLLPFVTERRATRETRCEAAGLLRAHARERGWRYLQDFPFEDAPYVVVSTQDRVTKNIGRAAESVRRLLRRDRVDVKLFTTAFVHFGENWTLLPGVIEREQMHRDAVSVHDLPRHVHAALFHCAAAVIHPSFFEGGHGPFPFYEAVSVGTPCLMGFGPHVAELLDEEPGLSPDTFDPYDEDGLARLLRTLLEGGREEVLERQRTIYERLRHRRSWGQVAEAYANAALGGLPGGVLCGTRNFRRQSALSQPAPE
jgi:glycosyltransferase involved in cell wall biosynthesis